MHNKILTSALFLTLAFTALQAQQKTNNKFSQNQNYWTLDVSAGAANYLGDLAPKSGPLSFDVGQTGLTAGASVSKRFTPRWSARIGLNWLRIRGSDFASADPNSEEGLKRYLRNLHFRNDLFEFSAVGVFDLIKHTGHFNTRPKWAPYLFGGLATVVHSPKAIAPTQVESYELVGDGIVYTGTKESGFAKAGEWIDLRSLQTEGVDYSSVVIALPLGAGVRYTVSPRVNLNFEFGHRITFTDYLDDVSSEEYPDIIDGDALRAAMSIRTMEVKDAVTGKDRNLLSYSTPKTDPPFDTRYYQYSDGTGYFSVNGYTHATEPEGNSPRGNPNKKDHYFSASLGVGIILGGTMPSRPKLR